MATEHDLTEMLVVAVLAILPGTGSWVASAFAALVARQF
jgi:hypothetical protein